MKKTILSVLTVGGLISGGAWLIAPATAQDAALAMLSKLDRGAWEVRFRDGSASRRICLNTGMELIQLRHREGDCNRYVVEDGANQVTIQYTCRGNGYGRTNIRRETNALVQVESQGIEGGAPFQFSAEARRVGGC